MEETKIMNLNTRRNKIPPARGKRISWEDIPFSVRKAVENQLGCSILKSQTQFEGFSPGFAAKLFLSDGRTVFSKAVGSSLNPRSPDIHRREIKIARKLPPDRNEFPKLLWAYDDGDWVVLLFENIEGESPKIPWNDGELSRVLHAISQLSESLTPSPLETITVEEEFKESFGSWRIISKMESELFTFKVLDPWCQRNIDRLVELEEKWETSATGNTLLHADIRADNIILAKDRVVFVDWPWACLGAKWIDLLFFLPSVAMQGGPKPWEIFDSHPLGKQADANNVTSVLTAVAGLFIRLGNKRPEPGLPNLREFQLGQTQEALEWLKIRTDWR
jgi:hypothetical protein